MTEEKKSKLDSWLSAAGLTPNSKPKVEGPQKSEPKPSRPARPSYAKATEGRPPRREGPSRPHPRSNAAPRAPQVSRAPRGPVPSPKGGRHPLDTFTPKNVGDIRIVPLGGMEQVGENMMFLEWEDDIIVIDMGLLFPSTEHLGVDVLVPNIEYLVQNKKKIRGVIFTHGHLDHIGAVPHLVKELGFPKLFGTKLTKELILANSAEHKEVAKNLKVIEINPTSKIKLGRFDVEFFHVNHSIPEGVGVAVRTPYGYVVHSSDFKFDLTPSDDKPCDLGRIGSLGSQGVALAMVDSTNALKSGHTLSESVIDRALKQLIEQTPGRLILTTFASNVGRAAKVIESAQNAGRTVFLSGRSMEKNMLIARKLNYLKCKDRSIQRMSNKADKMDPSKVLILSTGSQGEELAALTRMAAGRHKDVKLKPSDTIVFSSSPIPGNELAIVSVLNNLAELGVKTIDNKQLDTHVSGHGHAEECKLMTQLLNPKYFAPIHGELYMRHGHRNLVIKDLGFKPENTFIMKNGQGLVLNHKGIRMMKDKEAIPAGDVMMELGEKLHENVVAERTILSESGMIIITIKQHDGKVKDILVRSRGFRHMDMKHEIFEMIRKSAKEIFIRQYDPARPDSAVEKAVKEGARKLLFQKFKKDPMIEVVL